MSSRILESRVRQARPAHAVEQENLLAELLQHYVLASLGRAGLFREAAFHGGTCLRIVHGLERFSEDLDFVSRTVRSRFSWDGYLVRLARDAAAEGIHLEIAAKPNTGGAVKKAFVKAGSRDEPLVQDLPFPRHPGRKTRIKLEIDTNPPAGSTFETAYLGFPVTTALTVQTLESSFASKSHALLCRSYTKGRDWYDFLWYVSRRIRPSRELLQNAIRQQGPWAGADVEVTPAWYVARLREVIRHIDWTRAAADVERFLNPAHQETLAQWSSELFLDHVDQLERFVLR